ncbi:protein DUF218 [Candidatus Termititenax persephonae]|uniref:Protein DUF218 n=1 Tax=Candidatus Termititenax persephonae TaxID=2218525 RepID=A0A388TH16_9BACT|nr:protein DUF218 [Candidatus Termititenax persephonae]
MFLLGKIFTWTLLSPALFMLLLFLALGAALQNRRRTCVFLLILSSTLIYFLSAKPGRDLIIQPLETRYPPSQYAKSSSSLDVLIVLGGGVSRDGRPSHSSLQRLYAAHQIYKKKPLPIIVCGGDPLGNGVNESTVMAAILQSWGVPTQKIILEKQSRNTQENLKYAKIYLQKYKFQKPGLVTSAAHLPRAMQMARDLQIPAVPLPGDQRYEGAVYYWQDIFPNTRYLVESFAGLKEYFGLAYYTYSRKLCSLVK